MPNTQIIVLYKQGQTPEQIAEGLGITLAEVLVDLHRSNSLKLDVPKESDEEANLTPGQKMFLRNEEEISRILLDIARGSENDGARIKAAIYLHEEIHSRNAARVKNPSNGRGTLNIEQMHVHFNKASDAVSRALKRVNSEPVLELVNG